MQKEDEEPIYQGGFPKEQGWFDCRYNGIDERLQHWICPIAGRHHWKNLKGEYLERFYDIEWTGEADIYP